MEGKLKPLVYYFPNSDQIEYARAELNRKRFSRRGVFDGNRYQKLLGFLNEVVICDELGLSRPELFDGKADKGFDFIFNGKCYDAKVRFYHPKYGNPRAEKFDHLVPVSQLKEKHEIYLFSAINAKNKSLMFCGEISKSDLMKNGIIANKGETMRKYNGSSFQFKTDNYIILNNQLGRGTPLFRVETKKEGPNEPF